MLRPVLSSSAANGKWLVQLSCGHAQTSPAEPASGEQFECQHCDRFELPPHFVAYKQTPLFDETTIPAGILNEHSTKAGVWAKIHVVEGRLRYCVPALKVEREVTAGHIDIVVPEVVHNVQLVGMVKFYVEFHKAP
jgi:tellurite methyltransferase